MPAPNIVKRRTVGAHEFPKVEDMDPVSSRRRPFLGGTIHTNHKMVGKGNHYTTIIHDAEGRPLASVDHRNHESTEVLMVHPDAKGELEYYDPDFGKQHKIGPGECVEIERGHPNQRVGLRLGEEGRFGYSKEQPSEKGAGLISAVGTDLKYAWHPNGNGK